MKKKFKEIRVFIGNDGVNHKDNHIEFVYNTNFFQNQLIKFIGDYRVHYSITKSNELIFDPSQRTDDFIKALSATQLDNHSIVVYDEAGLLSQNLSGKGKINYIKNENEVCTIYNLIDIAASMYFDSKNTYRIDKFKKQCKEALQSQNEKEINNEC